MAVRLEIIGDNADEVINEFNRLSQFCSKAEPDRSVETLLEELRSKLADQGMTVRVVDREPSPKSSEADALLGTAETKPEPEPEPKPAATRGRPRKDSGGQPTLSKQEAAEALTTESPTARKARCVARLQALFVDGKKKEVMALLAEHGDGAKTFAAVPEDKFEAISKALETFV